MTDDLEDIEGTRLAILNKIYEKGRIKQSEIVRLTGFDKSTVTYHLNNLKPFIMSVSFKKENYISISPDVEEDFKEFKNQNSGKIGMLSEILEEHVEGENQ